MQRFAKICKRHLFVPSKYTNQNWALKTSTTCWRLSKAKNIHVSKTMIFMSMQNHPQVHGWRKKKEKNSRKHISGTHPNSDPYSSRLQTDKTSPINTGDAGIAGSPIDSHAVTRLRQGINDMHQTHGGRIIPASKNDNFMLMRIRSGWNQRHA